MDDFFPLMPVLAPHRLYVHLDSRYDATIQKLEQSIIKCMLVTAVKRNRADKVRCLWSGQGAGHEAGQGGTGSQQQPQQQEGQAMQEETWRWVPQQDRIGRVSTGITDTSYVM